MELSRAHCGVEEANKCQRHKSPINIMTCQFLKKEYWMHNPHLL